MRALIGFGRCQIPSPNGLSCSTPIFTCTILLHQLQANSWKYMCLRMMECLHYVTARWKVLKGLSDVWIYWNNWGLEISSPKSVHLNTTSPALHKLLWHETGPINSSLKGKKDPNQNISNTFPQSKSSTFGSFSIVREVCISSTICIWKGTCSSVVLWVWPVCKGIVLPN